MLSKTESQLLNELAKAHDDLVHHDIACTDSYTGELGEFYACRLLNLTRYPRSHKGADAYDSKGKTYQIKTKVITDANRNHTLRNLKPDCFDYLIVVHLNEQFEPIGMYRLPNDPGMVFKKSFASSELQAYKVNTFNLKLSEAEHQAIFRFSTIYQKVKSLQFIRSSNLVGDIGEHLAATKLNLTLASKNQKGYDATDAQGNKYEIKTRRVYDSSRRNSETRRINNLVGKETDFIVIVVLDQQFQCAGMWLVDPVKIENPKSANLRIVNTTADVRTVVASSISFLKDREPYQGDVKSAQTVVKKMPTKTNTAVQLKNTKPSSNLRQKDKRKKTGYPAIYFIGLTLLIYIFLIYPNNTLGEGIFYLILTAVVAWYLHRWFNYDPEVEAEKLRLFQEQQKETESRLKDMGLPLKLGRRTKRSKFNASLFENIDQKKQQRRDPHFECDCEQHLYGNCSHCDECEK